MAYFYPLVPLYYPVPIIRCMEDDYTVLFANKKAKKQEEVRKEAKKVGKEAEEAGKEAEEAEEEDEEEEEED